MSRWVALAAVLVALAAQAQPSAIVLVARPELIDPNFSGTVVLVTHTPSGESVGVILNRPTRLKLGEVAPEFPGAAAYRGRLYDGGPVLQRVIVALFRDRTVPSAAAFPVLDDAYLSLHPQNIGRLLAHPPGRFRLFSGFCGWAAGQLEAEIAGESWYVVPASEELLFREDTSGMWRELVDRARGTRADRARPAGYT